MRWSALKPFEKAAALVFAGAFFFRVYQLDLPIVEPYNSLSRQAIVATVARNFYQHGFNFFYPEIDENGPGPYLYNAEMPVYSYLMALMYLMAGGAREWASRLVSVLFSMGSLAFVYLFLRRLYDARHALPALVFLAFSPLYLAVSRALQPEAAMMFASTGTLYFLYLHYETGKARFLALSALLMAFAVATKVHSLYLFLPALYLAWRYRGASFLRDHAHWAYLAAALAPLVWYYFMWKAGVDDPRLIYRPYDFVKNRGPEGVSYWALFAPSFLRPVAKYFVFHLLTPLGVVLAAAGLFSKAPEKNKVFYAWLAASVVYVIFFWRILIDHSYYQIPLAPPLAFLMGKGWVLLGERVPRKTLWASLALLGVLSAANAGYFYRGIYFIPEPQRRIVATGEAVQRLTPPDSLVVASYDTGTIQLYYCNRKGWAFYVRPHAAESLIVEMELLRAQGADYYVIASAKVLDDAPGLESYLRSRYSVVDETDGRLLVALSEAPRV